MKEFISSDKKLEEMFFEAIGEDEWPKTGFYMSSMVLPNLTDDDGEGLEEFMGVFEAVCPKPKIIPPKI